MTELPAVALYSIRLMLPRELVEQLIGKGWSLGEATRRLEIVVGDLITQEQKEAKP